MPKTEYNIQSLEAAFTVIECIVRSGGKPLRFAEIRKMTGLTPNRTYRILSTLCGWGYLEKDPTTHEYRLGTTIGILAQFYKSPWENWHQWVAPILQELATKSRDFALLTVPYREDQMAVVDAAQGDFYLQGRTGLGEVFPLHGGASSKFFLAAMPEEKRSRVLDSMEYRRFTDKTITNRQDLEREIQKAVDQGYYVADEDLEPGLVSVGAPVVNDSGMTIASVSLVIPTVRYTEEHEREVIELILDAAKRISRRLGYIGKSFPNTAPMDRESSA